MRDHTILQEMKETGIIAIFRKVPQAHVLKTAEALYNSGIRAMEITLNTPGALDTIRLIRENFSDDLLVGAGTVTEVAQVEEAAQAGASFMLAPNVDEAVIQAVKARGKQMIPGAMTPTEIVQAVRAGGDIIKIFPAGTLGAAYFKDVLGPLDHVPLMAVGGVSVRNVRSFIANGAMSAGIGGSLLALDKIEQGDYAAIEALGRSLIDEVRQGRQ